MSLDLPLAQGAPGGRILCLGGERGAGNGIRAQLCHPHSCPVVLGLKLCSLCVPASGTFPGVLARPERSSGVPGPWEPWPTCPGCVAWCIRQVEVAIYSWERVSPLLPSNSPARGFSGPSRVELLVTILAASQPGDSGSFTENLLPCQALCQRLWRHYGGHDSQASRARCPILANNYRIQ